MGTNIKLAVMAGEDQLFPDHNGFDFKSIQKAMKHNRKSKSLRGASTISQQVAKNVFLWQHGGYFRKGLEVYFTFMIEQLWGKKRILEMYLNVAQTGPGIFGVEAAAKYINRIGLTYSDKKLSGTIQMSNVGDAFGDATNERVSTDPVAGYIPAYSVFDASATYKMGSYSIKAGINNIFDKQYFTVRSDEYPGPGIIPSVGRGFYVGISAKF